MLLEGKIVVVTGGAGRLGQEFSRAIAKEGGLPIVADIALDHARVVAETLRREGLSAHAAQLDITCEESISSLIGEFVSRYGKIDAVVNNAYPRNKNYGRPIEDVQYADFCENVSLHLGGYFLVAQKFAGYFKNCERGNIVNISSIYGIMAPRFDVYEGTTMTMPVEYAAIKSAIIHLTRYFAQYFKKNGVKCNAISPGGIADGQPAAFLDSYKAYAGNKGMLDTADVCGALIFLLSDLSDAINGQNLVVDDGFSL